MLGAAIVYNVQVYPAPREPVAGNAAMSAPGTPARLVPPGVYDTDKVACRNGVVVSISHPASDAGVLVLKEGGNAVDAAVATAFALAVTYPAAGNLGGGGFMLVHPAPGKGAPTVFDYRETAPAAATPAMFRQNESQYRPHSVAVPGTLRGMALAHKRFGALPWKQLLEPAIALASTGFSVDPYFADLLNDVLTTSPHATELQRVFGHPGGGMWKAGDRLVQPDLAQTLRLIADQGPDVFYKGPIAADIVAEMGRFGGGVGTGPGDGLITAADLAGYQAIERPPLTTRYRGRFDVYTPPAPSSGGPVLIEELNMLETFDLSAWDRWAPELVHVMVEAMRRAACDRARYLGDPAFVQIPDKLATKAYARELAKTIDLAKATRSAAIASDIHVTAESENTTHFSVIDKEGMAVANTYTLERIWGARIVVKGRGFLLNNDMRAFNLFPGITTAKGDIGTEPNTIAPGKRPLSSQMPTIVARDGRVLLVTGSPGSQAIPNTILEILVDTLDYHMSLPDAVEAPRFSHQWLPDQVTFESPERYPQLVNALEQVGHLVTRTGPLPQGDAHSIWVPGPKSYLGVADHRRNSMAAPSGY
jgi:gamma-glutamyltranspeptidase/glutathione hydrolase